ncbi:hypothetical protein Tco_0784601 [Tanacetum coccineum]
MYLQTIRHIQQRKIRHITRQLITRIRVIINSRSGVITLPPISVGQSWSSVRRYHYYEDEYFTNFEEEFPAIVFGKINASSFDTEQGMITGEYNGEDPEIEFPAIVLNNTLTSGTSPHYEPTVSAPNENKIDFRIALDESDDEDYTTALAILKMSFLPLFIMTA